MKELSIREQRGINGWCFRPLPIATSAPRFYYVAAMVRSPWCRATLLAMTVILAGCVTAAGSDDVAGTVLVWEESREAPWRASSVDAAVETQEEIGGARGIPVIRFLPSPQASGATSFMRDLSGIPGLDLSAGRLLRIRLEVRSPARLVPSQSVFVSVQGRSAPLSSVVFGDVHSDREGLAAAGDDLGPAWHRITFDLDGRGASSVADIDGVRSPPQRFAPEASEERVSGLVIAVTGVTEVSIRGLEITAMPFADVVAADRLALGYSPSGVSSYQLEPGQALFSNYEFRWKQVPREFQRRPALRAELNRESPLTIHCAQGGTLYAILWLWDYGFLGNLPASTRALLNGWRLVREDGGSIDGASAPFEVLPLFCRELAAGDHQIDLAEYWGQWVIVGYTPSRSAARPADVVPAASIEGSLTRHNIVEPGAEFRITSSTPISGYSVFRAGRIVSSGEAALGTAPLEPGRYALQARFPTETRILPLTVGYGKAASQGWEPGFFPIHFYNGWSYRGVFMPNPPLLLDLEKIAMFELGANAFFLSARNEVVEALGCRVILNVRKATMPIARTSADDRQAEEKFGAELTALEPLPDDVLGLYVEDEPPLTAASRLGAMERVMQEREPRVPLLYTVQGARAPELWATAGSTVRMTRAYPIRKARRGDLVGSIRAELSDFLIACQERGQSYPLWIVVQAFGDRGLWDRPTPAQLRLMVFLSLARGAKGLTYFCFDSSPAGPGNLTALARWPFVPQDDRYDEVGRIDAKIRFRRGFLTSLTWIEAFEPARNDVDVQILATSRGDRFAWVTNWDTEHPTKASLRLPGLSGDQAVELGPAASVIVDLQTGEQTAF